ncbi:MAG: AbrB/MazE/SpoVT family DNA-binding domain-containing protein [Alphaproteobacteria bacterium]|nr:AbrB/MazE/SpoVT family DNA-binding domain-containing protein [Alphaproteobacteria bacterium]MDE2493379.1 AbrB/MazE/SpoVT family DNA-binding domain-containing protein [Alphaproteobacteria bacterium]MDE2499710.1 AbrB/MazE/SpoVT family DNA-binding domain-containing protein [Alphaproteobacteria bacterium]
MVTTAQAIEADGELAIVLPQEVLTRLNIGAGDTLDAKIDGTGITIFAARTKDRPEVE